MNWLRFFSKVAFLCNLLFLLAIFLQFVQVPLSTPLVSLVVIAGYLLAVFVFNPFVVVSYVVCLFRKVQLFSSVPRWLVLLNSLFLVLQILYLTLFLNDTFYN